MFMRMVNEYGPSNTRHYASGSYSNHIRHNSADSVPTSDIVSIKMASILIFQSLDVQHRGTFSNQYEVVTLSMKSLAILKDQVKILPYKMLINERKPGAVSITIFNSLLTLSFNRSIYM